jgi:hypothetical protein
MKWDSLWISDVLTTGSFLDCDLVWETNERQLRELRLRKVCVRVEVYVGTTLLGYKVSLMTSTDLLTKL